MLEMKNPELDISTILPETDIQDACVIVSSKETESNIELVDNQKIKKGIKRGRGRPPKKQFSSRSNKQKPPNPEWIGRWIRRQKTRRSGRSDTFFIHKTIPNLTCRSKKEVERFEKDGTRPGKNANKRGNEK
uniref:Uncharacterized protein LOC113786556 n=1 Tax=Cicer arietinum TaxID=3827 RepID=A0A3Q7YB06_CICAR|nr:uncharacterized protein LOC113786556 [Cicer arietinum]